MSTKIYYAWRTPQNKFTEALKLFHDAILESCLQTYKSIVEELDEQKIRKKYDLDKDVPFSFRIRAMAVHDLFVNMAKSGDDFLGCGFNCWFHTDDMVYIIPWGLPGIIEKIKTEDFPNWVEEYCYYNNTDRPKHLTDEEWNERAKTWQEVGPNNDPVAHHKYRLQHTVATAENWSGLLVLEEEYKARYAPDEER